VLNGATTLAANKNFTAAAGTGALDFSLGTGAFKTSTGAVTLNGNTSVVSGKTLAVGGGTAIKAIELGTCTEATAAAIFTCTAATTSGLTMGNLVITDAISIVSQVSAGGNCDPDLITAATSFRIRCSVAPSNGIVFNVLIVRR